MIVLSVLCTGSQICCNKNISVDNSMMFQRHVYSLSNYFERTTYYVDVFSTLVQKIHFIVRSVASLAEVCQLLSYYGITCNMTYLRGLFLVASPGVRSRHKTFCNVSYRTVIHVVPIGWMEKRYKTFCVIGRSPGL